MSGSVQHRKKQETQEVWEKNTDLRSSEGAQSAHWYYRVHLNSGNVNQPVSHCFSPGLLACS